MPELRLRDMTEDEFAEFERAAIAGYAQDLALSATDDESAALEYSTKDWRELLPEGQRSEGHVIAIAEDVATGEGVGILWMKLGDPRGLDAEQAFILDIEIWPQWQGQGYGKALMALAEARALAEGRTTMGLNVFGHNPRAQALYASLGYETVSVSMRKRLGAGVG